MKQKNLLLVSIILSTVFAGYLVFQKNQLRKSAGEISSRFPNPEVINDWNIDKNNVFTSKYYGFSVKFPATWALSFEKYIENPTYILSASNSSKNYEFRIYVAKKGLESLPGPTGFGAGEWKDNGYFTLLGQRLQKKSLIYEGKTQDVIYQTLNERNVIFPTTDTLFLFLIGTVSTNEEFYSIPLSAEAEFEQILSTFKLI